MHNIRKTERYCVLKRIILYYAAALGIKLTVDLLTGEKKQTYFRGHDDDVSAMCILDPENSVSLS